MADETLALNGIIVSALPGTTVIFDGWHVDKLLTVGHDRSIPRLPGSYPLRWQGDISRQDQQRGVRVFSIEYAGSSPSPMKLFGVYVLLQGIACGTIEMGGIGQPWNAPPFFLRRIPVLISSNSHGISVTNAGRVSRHLSTTRMLCQLWLVAEACAAPARRVLRTCCCHGW